MSDEGRGAMSVRRKGTARRTERGAPLRFGELGKLVHHGGVVLLVAEALEGAAQVGFVVVLVFAEERAGAR